MFLVGGRIIILFLKIDIIMAINFILLILSFIPSLCFILCTCYKIQKINEIHIDGLDEIT